MEEGTFPEFLQLLKEVIWVYKKYHICVFVWLRYWDYVSQLTHVLMFLLRAVVYILVRKVSPRGPMCFRCLMLRLSDLTELLFLLCCIASWTWVVVRVIVCLGSL